MPVGRLFIAAALVAVPAGPAAAGVVAWLAAPFDPARGHDIAMTTAWHGRFMVLAWAILFPTGILAARFFKVTPGQDWPRQVENPTWWRIHLSTQYAGAAAALLALLLIFGTRLGAGDAAVWHRVVGWGVMGLLAAQVAGSWFRGTKGGPTAPAADGSTTGDHYDMTPRRYLFEYVHKSTGYVAILMACGAIVTGLYVANAPRWMWLTIAAWWLVLAAAAVWLQTRGFAIDTYQAIWGPDPRHPGNSTRRPPNFAVKRHDP